ncbi:DNA-binding transcriptional regulator YhcF, GntR family [Pedobacter antarcticus]|uniref:DNA-binding transcriptional regulator YhcF, GntR family n=1 Tax=Pedobacter antarcticus TaxID=34086 RepID=A0A1I2BNC2_9SPHI|nr:GntR family transcriptional regulator [Pedobacter antarcticus]SFE57559.1 DNA-binding transcriptional regulator YhcF, GntR family [Pedobacter antarcticus]
MYQDDIIRILKLDLNAGIPKYQQLANAIMNATTGHINENDALPSINKLSVKTGTSRRTVERAYIALKNNGAVKSVAGKGYFLTGTSPIRMPRIMLLFDRMTLHKRMIYDAFVSEIQSFGNIDLHLYDNNFNRFRDLLSTWADSYDHYVIIPCFAVDEHLGYKLINNLPSKKLILVDTLPASISGEFSAIYENYEQDIFNALEELIPHLIKYRYLKIIFSKHACHSNEILIGFLRFCHKNGFESETVFCLNTHDIRKNSVYISLNDDELPVLIEKINEKQLTAGTDIGLISYHDAPYKKFMWNGITTISSDFVRMGKEAAGLILNNSKVRIEIPFRVIKRNSL